MSITKLFPSGDYLCSTIVHNQLVRQRYSGYTKRQAVARFRQYLKSLRNPN